MLHEFLDGRPQGSFSEQDDPLQARLLDGFDEAFRIGSGGRHFHSVQSVNVAG